MSIWFANRGQIVQVVAAAGAASLALFVAVKQDMIRIDLALAIGVIVALVLLLLFRKHDRPSVGMNAASTEASSLNTAETSLQENTAHWSSATVRLRKGERWIDDRKGNEFKLLGLKSTSSGLKAITSVRTELNSFCTGQDVERTGNNFLLPESSFHDQNALVVSYTVSKFVLCFSIRAEHINEHLEEVEFVITTIS